MDRSGLATAAQLLAKASSTEFDAEAVALVDACYRLLARLLNEVEATSSSDGPRRRERRLRLDRRRSKRSDVEPAGRRLDPVRRYGELATPARTGRRGTVDLQA